MSGDLPFIKGPGLYLVNVAGESFYPESFIALAGPRRPEGVQIETRAQLTLQDDNEYDKLAVQVTISGYQVGHLPKDAARAFRRTVRYGPLSVYETFECAAIICGGWDTGNGNVGHFGVRLDLLLDGD
ncbi:HIRAN domain-containing protein [Massilia sp. GER05]|uniref:HIRAN domain-containing protein n=1 Tax=Massilia sp. GER05 TaxID=3394605 RepID=UPI003F843EC7